MVIEQSDLRRCGLAWAAKIVCSGVFITGRDPWDIVTESCGWMIATDEEVRALIVDGAPLDLEERLTIDIEPELSAVTLRLDETLFATARLFEGQGCIIVPAPASDVRFTPTPVEPAPFDPDCAPWPAGELLTDDPARTGIDLDRVDSALDLLFENPHQHTCASVVVHKGVLVRERYREPFSRDSRLESWSMGKSIAASLVGILIRDGLADLRAPLPFEEWKSPGDPRSRIRLEDLLHMSSGLEFTARDDPTQESPAKTRAGRMLDQVYVYAGGIDSYEFCSRKAAEFPPNSVGRYRNCDPLLATRLVRDTVRELGGDFLLWPQRNLFDPLGITGTVLETDPYGNFLLCGHNYGRARDWARLGFLYLERGAWGGKQILPESFVEFVQQPAPAFEEPGYGALFWLNRARAMRSLPEDAYWMGGAGGQRTVIVPSLDLVIVRMGHLAGALAGWADTMDRACAVLAQAAVASNRS